MAVPKKPATVAGRGQVVVVSRERFSEAMGVTWDDLLGMSNDGDIIVKEAATSDGLVNPVRPAAGFASIREGDGRFKGRPVLFEQNW